MDLNLSGKTALITGGSKGIGRAIAKTLLAEGADVTLAARDAHQLATTQSELRAETARRCEIIPADLSSDDGRMALVEAVQTPDILVNNAGAIRAGRLGDLSVADWRQDCELKVFGYTYLCQLFQPKIAELGSGAIWNIIGMAGRTNRAAYISGSTANAALIAFTQSLGAEVQTQRLRIFGINPSPALTDRMADFIKQKAATELGDTALW